MSEKPPIPFLFNGNQPALDLANTLILNKDGPFELLTGLAVFATWMGEAKQATPDQLERLCHWSEEAKLQFLAELKEYRQAIKSCVASIESSGSAPETFLTVTNRLLKRAEAVIQVEKSSGTRCHRMWCVNWNDPNSVLGVVGEMGLKLVCDCDPKLIRKCENDKCVLVFLDTTKNHQRRWCSMEECGNRNKATLHRRRKKESTPTHLE